MSDELMLAEFDLPFGWTICFPDDWEHESSENENVFYPPYSELTIRIAVFNAENEQGKCPADMMRDVYFRTHPSTAKEFSVPFQIEGFELSAFENTFFEKRVKVYRICVGCWADGKLVLVNLFSTDREECVEGLEFISTLTHSE